MIMTLSTSPVFGAQPAPAGPATLRGLLDARRAEGRRVPLDEAVALFVPLCLDLKTRHDRGERLYVHPSCVAIGADGVARFDAANAVLPTNPRDRLCVAPELQARLDPGDARATVFSIGAMFYEAITGSNVGPAMRRPREVDPSLPESVEVLLGKALVGDAAHRPDDLGALASAIHNLAPKKSIVPPPADESRLDHTDSFDVDIRLSMLPPAEVVPPQEQGIDAYARSSAPTSTSVNDPTARLAQLKARLESDPRPRYVVTKDRMDHGPFNAVELLQQIASHKFVGADKLRDEISGQDKPIEEWEEFSPFAEQAKIHRDILEEKKEVAKVAEAEKKAGLAKSTLGIAFIVALVAAGGVFLVVKRGLRNDEVNIQDDNNLNVDGVGSVKGKAGKKPAKAGGGGGGNPGYAYGMSYEEALSKNVTEINIGGPSTGPDLTDKQLQDPINARMPGILSSCGAGAVTVKIAIKNGQAVGVTVIPPNPCVDRGVRSIQWPAHPKMDTLTTTW